MRMRNKKRMNKISVQNPALALFLALICISKYKCSA